MAPPTKNQMDARTENNVLRAFGSLFTALRQSGLEYPKELTTAYEYCLSQIEVRRDIRKLRREHK